MQNVRTIMIGKFFFLHIKARSTVFVIFKKEIKPKNET